MTLERRQFLPTSAVNGQGLDRELTVDTSAQTLRVHTMSNPQGVILAKKSETDSLSSAVTSLGNTLATSVDNLQQQIDTIETGSSSACYYASNVNTYYPVTDATISPTYPYYAKIEVPLENPLTAEEAASVTANVAFSPIDVLVNQYASFCTVTARQVDEDAYLPVVVIYSKTNSRSFSAWVTLWLNQLVTSQA